MLKIGDKDKRVCNSCFAEVGVTYKLTDIKIPDVETTVKDILAAVCDECGDVVSVPSEMDSEIEKQVMMG